MGVAATGLFFKIRPPTPQPQDERFNTNAGSSPSSHPHSVLRSPLSWAEGGTRIRKATDYLMEIDFTHAHDSPSARQMKLSPSRRPPDDHSHYDER